MRRSIGIILAGLFFALFGLVGEAQASFGVVPMTISGSPNPSTQGQLVTFIAKVLGPGAPAPTGTVTFKDGSTVLGNGTLSTSGFTLTATFSTASLSVGSHAIKADYSGDPPGVGDGAGFYSPTFATTTQVVNVATTNTTTNNNVDSQNIHSLQTSITNVVATTSGQAITNAIDSGINDGFSNGGTQTIFGPNGGFINFASEPKSEIASRTDEAFSALAYAGNINKAPNFNKAPPLLDRQWSAWADIRGTGWKVNDTTGNDLKGNQINITAGVGRKLTSDMLVGVVGGYEHFKYDVSALAGSLKGDGETIGGYYAQRFGSNLRFDAALAWTNLNYSATAGTATGSFNASRWLASTGLTGNYKVNVYVIEPSAKVYMLWESQRAWTDSLGTLQTSRDFSAGRTALGAKVARPFEISNGWTLSPFAGLYGDWRFQTANALPTGTPVANIGDGWSGRVTGGVSATAVRGAMVSLAGDYGGLGASYKIWTGNVRGTVPF